MIEQEELISVIVPVYNTQQYLNRCVESILKQSYSNFELVLVDDGSKDDSAIICDKYQDADYRVRVIHQENSGVSSARNRGIYESKGNYISFIDSDDWVDEGFLESLYSSLIINNADLSAMGYVLETGGGHGKNEICKNEEVLSAADALSQAMDRDVPWVGYAGGKLLRKDIIIKNEIRFDTDISICEDSLFHYSYIDKVDKVVKIPACEYHYFIRDDSATRTAFVNYKNLKSKIDAFNKAKIIADRYPESEFKKRVDLTLFSSSIDYLSALFVHGIYEEDELLFVKDKLNKLESEVEFERLTRGTKIRYLIYNISPRLLFCFEWFRMHV